MSDEEQKDEASDDQQVLGSTPLKSAITPLLTPNDVASILQVKPVSVYRWAKMGFLPSIKIGSAVRFVESDLAAFLDERRKASTRQDE